MGFQGREGRQGGVFELVQVGLKVEKLVGEVREFASKVLLSLTRDH